MSDDRTSGNDITESTQDFESENQAVDLSSQPETSATTQPPVTSESTESADVIESNDTAPVSQPVEPVKKPIPSLRSLIAKKLVNVVFPDSDPATGSSDHAEKQSEAETDSTVQPLPAAEEPVTDPSPETPSDQLKENDAVEQPDEAVPPPVLTVVSSAHRVEPEAATDDDKTEQEPLRQEQQGEPQTAQAPVELEDPISPATEVPVELEDSIPAVTDTLVGLEDSISLVADTPVELEDPIPALPDAPVRLEDPISPLPYAPVELEDSISPVTEAAEQGSQYDWADFDESEFEPTDEEEEPIQALQAVEALPEPSIPQTEPSHPAALSATPQIQPAPPAMFAPPQQPEPALPAIFAPPQQPGPTAPAMFAPPQQPGPTAPAMFASTPAPASAIDPQPQSDVLRTLFSSDNLPMPAQAHPQAELKTSRIDLLARKAKGLIDGSKKSTSELAPVQKKNPLTESRNSTGELESIQRQSLLGKVVADNYVILDSIGEGALCLVYSAMTLVGDDLVALKTLKHPRAELRARFKEAVMQLSKLKHRNVVQALTYVEEKDGRSFLAMEHVQGVSLEEVLRNVNYIEDEDAIASILIQIVNAFEHAHENSVLHGHLTPRDIIMIDQGGPIDIKVTDFGITSLNDGTRSDWAYMSPERIDGDPPSVLSDVYAFAVIAYRLIGGRFPFSEEMVRKKELDEAPPSLAVLRPDLRCSHHLNQLLIEALDKNPEWRIDSMKHLKEGLVDWLDLVHRDSMSTGAHKGLSADSLSELAATVPTPLEPRDKQNLSSTIHNLTALKVPDADTLLPAAGDEAKVPALLKKTREKNRFGSTFNNLVALKHNLFDKEQTLVVQLTSNVAQSGQRRSPISTIMRLVASIIICGGITIGSGIYVCTHFDEVSKTFNSASRGLASFISPDKDVEPIPGVDQIPGEDIDAHITVAPKTQKKPANAQTATSTSSATAPAAPTQDRIVRFKYEESPMYMQWSRNKKEIGKVRRLESK